MSFPINGVCTLLSQVIKTSQFQDPEDWAYHKLEGLNREIKRIPGTSFADAQLKGIWQGFYQASRHESHGVMEHRLIQLYEEMEKHLPQCPHRGFFEDTDLIIYPDDYEGILPYNAIKETDFENLNRLYNRLFQKIRLKGSIGFNEGVLRDIRRILTRPVGRELIERILQKLSGRDIEIFPYQECAANIKTLQICYTLDPEKIIQVLPNGEFMTLNSPSFINLAHEFIHILHGLEGTLSRIDDPSLHRLDTSPEESRTIYGSGDDRICEAEFRKQFELLERRFHSSGVSGNPENDFKAAAHYGLHGNIRKWLPSVSEAVREEALQRQRDTLPTLSSPDPRSGVDVIMDECLRNPHFCPPSLWYLRMPPLVESPPKPQALDGRDLTFIG